MKQKRILFLGASYAQIPIIEEAKKRGWYIITCDYLPDNPGHRLSNEYYNVSTTDMEKVYDLAKSLQPDFIVAYASDPAAPIASYVAERLGLPGNSYESVKILSEKDLFREFLVQHGFNTPKSISVTEKDLDYKSTYNLQLPVIVKPTDSSGSKGVSRVEDQNGISKAINFALNYSRNKRIIIEEFIDNDLGDIHGDGFVVDGELVFSCLGDHIYKGKINPFNPTGTAWPSRIPCETIAKIEVDVAEIIKLCGFKNGPINIEARVNHLGTPFVMEIGPRNGGHFVPQAIEYATKFDMVSSYLDLIDNKKPMMDEYQIAPTAYIAVHSEKDGILDKVEIKEEIKPYIKEFHQYIKEGNVVKSFQGANAAIGILLLSFRDIDEMDYYIRNINQFLRVFLKEK